jgi:hypothetical protein
MTGRPTITDDRRRLARLRLVAQRLAGVDPCAPSEAVRWMLGLQAQDLPGAKWSVALRADPATTEADVEAAFDRGELVRSWPLRGTLHLVAAEDLPWLLELTASRALASAADRRARLGITEADVERARVIALDALAGRRMMTRPALLAAFEAGGVATGGQRGYHLLWYLAQTGSLVLAASDGRQQTFARLDEWVPDPRRRAEDEALGELAARYFRSHGPATAHDLARWSGLTVRDVRRGILVAGAALATIQVGDTAFHLAPETLDATAPAAGVTLLPGFDEYVLGYRDRSAVLAPEHADAIVPGGNGMFRATVVVDGEVAGTWSRRASRGGVVIDTAPFDGWAVRDLGGIEAAVERYGRFIDRPVRLAPPAEDPGAKPAT